eukprot:3638471-Pyramimonas_sp.AAC.1
MCVSWGPFKSAGYARHLAPPIGPGASLSTQWKALPASGWTEPKFSGCSLAAPAEHQALQRCRGHPPL